MCRVCCQYTYTQYTFWFCVGCVAVRTPRHWEDFTGQGRGSPHRVYLHPRVWIGTGAKVHWRGLQDGARALRYGQVTP